MEQNLKLALASSSFLRIINAVIKRLKLGKYFSIVHSAEFEEYGKPHPAIYINSAKQLGVAPTQCLAFEDSFNGLVAARAARMKAVAVPEQEHYHLPKFEIAHLKLNTLKAFGPDHLTLLKDIFT
jgi:sugar-phosphatase